MTVAFPSLRATARRSIRRLLERANDGIVGKGARYEALRVIALHKQAAIQGDRVTQLGNERLTRRVVTVAVPTVGKPSGVITGVAATLGVKGYDGNVVRTYDAVLGSVVRSVIVSSGDRRGCRGP